MSSSKANAARRRNPAQWPHHFFSSDLRVESACGYYACVSTGKLFGPVGLRVLPDSELEALLFDDHEQALGEAIFHWLNRIEGALVESIDQVSTNGALT